MLHDRLIWRYATKKMDPARPITHDQLDRILDAIRLAPTSSGVQPFEVVVVTNPEVRARLSEAAYGQQQLVDGSHVLVFAAWDNYTAERIDAVVAQHTAERGASETLTAYYERLKTSYLGRDAETNHEHAARQAYIAFGVATVAAAFEEVDATPMEGFDADKVDEILGLRGRGLRSVTLLPLGHRAIEGDWLLPMQKVRKPLDKLVTRVV